MVSEHCNVFMIFLLCLNHLLNDFASHRDLGRLLVTWWRRRRLRYSRGAGRDRDSLDTGFVNCGSGEDGQEVCEYNSTGSNDVNCIIIQSTPIFVIHIRSAAHTLTE